MTDDSSCCAGGSCGCRMDVYTTTQPCPECGKRLRLSGHAQRLELRLNCQHCGYTGPLLSAPELQELL